MVRGDGPASSDCIVIDDSDDEQYGSSLFRKRHPAGPSNRSGTDKPQAGHQSQPISIDELDSDNGQDAIDILFGNGGEAGVVVKAAEGAVTVTNNTIITSDQADQALPLLINILPDLDPEHGLELLRDKILANGQSFSIEHCLQTALESLLAEDGYPKVQKSCKRKRVVDSDDDEDGDDVGSSSSSRRTGISDDLLQDPTCRIFQSGKSAYKSKTFLVNERTGAPYRDRSLFDLDNLFPMMAAAHIRCIFSANIRKFVPTYIALKAETLLPDDEKPYVALKQDRPQKPMSGAKGASLKKGKKKAKGKSMAGAAQDGEAGFDAEREWFIAYLMNKGDGTSYDHARILVPASEEGDTECGCCFGDDELAFMVQCAEGHSFCRECIRKMTEVAVGAQTANVVCPHTDGCDAKFHDRDLKKALSIKLYNTYCGIIQRKELEDAGIEGLESCPYCNFAVIIENQEERLFNCQSDECGKVSCRKCRKHEHLPKTCEEAAKDNVLDHRHAIEEAMSEALIRKCPKCGQACVKEAGCNKMRCQNCTTLFCNVCRATITGYEHFDQTPANYKQPKDGKKCRLWDPLDKDLYRDEVAAAREAARQQALEGAGDNIAQGDIDVALPEVNIVPHRLPIMPMDMPLYYQAALLNRGVPPLPAIPAGPADRADRLARLRLAVEQAGMVRDQLERVREGRNRGRVGGQMQLDLAQAAARLAQQQQAMERARNRLAELEVLARNVDEGANRAAGRRGERPPPIVPVAPLPRHGRPPAAAGNLAEQARGREVRFQAPPRAQAQEELLRRAPPRAVNNVGRQQGNRAVRVQDPILLPPAPAPAPARLARNAQPQVPADAGRGRPAGAVRFQDNPVVPFPLARPDLQEMPADYGLQIQQLLDRLYQPGGRNPMALDPGIQAGFAVAAANIAPGNPARPRVIPHVANPVDRGGNDRNGNQNFITLDQAKQQLETTMRSIQREFPALQQAQILTAARQQSEVSLPDRVRGHELAISRRVSPRNANGIPVDPISVLLLVHQRHPGWCEQYYDHLVGGRPGFGVHRSFNQYAAAIIDDLKEGRAQPPAVPAQRTTFHVLRQPHACWNIGATNLIALLERVMQNAGAVFPPERPVARTTVMCQNLIINACPERIMLMHHRILLEHLLEQRINFRNRAAAPRRVINIDDGGNDNNGNRAGVPAAGVRLPANPLQAFADPILVDAPPPYEAVDAPRRPVGRARLRAGRLPA